MVARMREVILGNSVARLVFRRAADPSIAFIATCSGTADGADVSSLPSTDRHVSIISPDANRDDDENLSTRSHVDHSHRVAVSTAGVTQNLAIPAKASGPGSGANAGDS